MLPGRARGGSARPKAAGFSADMSTLHCPPASTVSFELGLNSSGLIKGSRIDHGTRTIATTVRDPKRTFDDLSMLRSLLRHPGLAQAF